MPSEKTLSSAPGHAVVTESSSPLTLPAPYFAEDGITIYHGDCREVLPLLGGFELLMTDPPYEMEIIPECVWSCAPCCYVFGDKRMVASAWFSQCPLKNKDVLAWHYKNSPKPKGRWRMSMQSIIYGFEDFVRFDEDAARTEYSPSAKKLNGRMRPSAGRMASQKPYDTSKGALPRDVIEWPALLGHLSRERVGHRDQKPLGLIEMLIRTVVGVTKVCDPYGGSGTTGVACRNLGIECVLIEDDESDCEMAAKRFR